MGKCIDCRKPERRVRPYAAWDAGSDVGLAFGETVEGLNWLRNNTSLGMGMGQLANVIVGCSLLAVPLALRYRARCRAGSERDMQVSMASGVKPAVVWFRTSTITA